MAELFSQPIINALIIPFCVWITLSIFNQRQEIALLKQMVSEIKRLIDSIVNEK